MADGATSILLVGNPGGGKSTLLNALIGEVAFRSGTSGGTGLTYQFDKRTQGNVSYLDTPGLEDEKKRVAAAKAITEALKQAGNYKVFFVITVESARVRPADVATMQIILEAAPITEYGLVINKVSPHLMQKLHQGSPTLEEEVKACLFAKMRLSTQHIRWICRQEELDDENDVLWQMPPDLRQFFFGLEGMTIEPQRVRDIDPTSYKQRVEQQQELISALRANHESMLKAVRCQRLRENGLSWRLSRLRSLRSGQPPEGLAPEERQELEDLESLEPDDLLAERRDAEERRQRQNTGCGAGVGGALAGLLGALVAGPVGATAGAYIGGVSGGIAGYSA